MAADGQGHIWVSSYGESSWSQDSEGNWIQSMSEPMGLYRASYYSMPRVVQAVKDVHVSCMTKAGEYIYAIGNAAEMTGGYDNTLYKIGIRDMSVTATSLSKTDAAKVGNPYGICVAYETGDIYIADADYTGPGKVWCFTKDLKEKWSAVAGMLPAHMALY